MTTVATIIEDSAYAAQVIGQDQPLSSGDGQLILRRLQRMLDSWANEGLMVYANTTQTFTMTASDGDYSTTVLTNGRPVVINSMTVSLSNIDYPVTMIDLNRWNEIGYKLTESIPNQCYYDATFPNGTMYFYPKPYAAFTCTVDCRYPLTDSSALVLATDLVLPEGYEVAIIDNLALDIWPSFKGGMPTPWMFKKATESKAVLKRTNDTPQEMDSLMSMDWGNISNAFLYKGF